MTRDALNKISSQIIGGAIEVHKELGPGLLESVYGACLAHELRNRGLLVEEQVHLPLIYKNESLNKDFILDLLVEKEVIVELKAVEEVHPVHEVQLVTYLKLANKKLGLLINFNVPLLHKGIYRKVNNL
ncbi:GxxExxY protein [Anaerophaga thermohalophila]|jgi:GxxExxY protein|uniref:GxxExxY protein n=1 Tax=Anaerophaga thermohalophila TaxID=177400 RepID=UPI00031910B1|nr:GxxExxY protein [Anaerophaga thermohalophila]